MAEDAVVNLIHKASDSIFCLQSPKLCCLSCAKSKDNQVNWPVLRKHRMRPHWLGSNCFCFRFINRAGPQKECSVQNQILIRTAIIWGYVWHHEHRLCSAALLQRGTHRCLSPRSHLLYSSIQSANGPLHCSAFFSGFCLVWLLTLCLPHLKERRKWTLESWKSK